MIDEKVLNHREAQKRYKQTPKGKLVEKKYRQTEKFKISNKQSRIRSFEHKWVYNLIYRAKKIGKLLQKPCEICGIKNSVAHHDDYYRPLNIQWFCRYHHAEYHKNRKLKI